MKAFIFPGQGSQFPGMGSELYASPAKEIFDKANDILGFDIAKIMIDGTKEDLQQTKVTQPAIFIHSVGTFMNLGEQPELVAGHSLGEFSALVANGSISVEAGLELVKERAFAMQAACEEQKSTMAAVLSLEDGVVEDICAKIEGIVVPANYNCPGQLVISGAYEAVEEACEKLKEAGARRALILPVGGAFHSPLMNSAKERLQKAIDNTTFNQPSCPIFQNVTAKATSNPDEIKENLIQQLTAPVRWTQTIQNMSAYGATSFKEIGPGKVLQGLVKKINAEAEVMGA
ncbi:MAG: ACP S-malonyltransferase [Flavobacteriales bacterium]|nr:ACP S-malonyltransferase [Flavobacteriales bacterium]